jgi:Spy/CpxP family protein refolding chaperone
MKAKVIVLTFCLFALGLFSAISQDIELGSLISKEKLEKIQSMKISFLTKELDLTVTESQAFWPVYNEYQQKKSAISDNKAEILKKIMKGYKDIPDKDAIALADELVSLEQQEAALLQEYNQKFKKVLSPQKVLKLYLSENKFKLELLKEIKGRIGKFKEK